MLVELKLLKRQDLVSVISNMMKPSHDQVKIRVNMNAEDMDTFVFCLAHKKSAGKMVKEMQDLMTYCPEKRPVQEKFGYFDDYFFSWNESCQKQKSVKPLHFHDFFPIFFIK